MKSESHYIADLSAHLFWDVDRVKIEWDKDPFFLVQRVLEFGLEKDWQILKKNYGIEKIAEIAKDLRSLDEVAMHFIATISNTPIEDFRCYKFRQLNPHSFEF